VVRRAVSRIECVRFAEAGDDALDPGRSEDTQRLLASRDPGLHVELAELADVVGVEVREQDAADLAAIDLPEREVVPGARARVDHPEAATRKHRHAGPCAGRVRHGRRRPAEDDAQCVIAEEP
jgi:hypothetical protein